MNYSINGIRKYYDNIARDYDNLYLDEISKVENIIVRDLLTKKILNTKKTNVRILDLGCGTGLVYELLRNHKALKHLRINYDGIDISSEMINVANSAYTKDDKCNFIAGDMKDIQKYFCEPYDIICSSFGSFSHSFENKSVLKACHNLLAPDGKIFLMVYSKYSMRAIVNYFLSNKKSAFDSRQPYDVRNNNSNESCDALFYSKSEIQNTLKVNGFNITDVKGLNVFFEIPALKNIFKNASVRKIMRLDSFIAGIFPDLGHSIIINGEKR